MNIMLHICHIITHKLISYSHMLLLKGVSNSILISFFILRRHYNSIIQMKQAMNAKNRKKILSLCLKYKWKASNNSKATICNVPENSLFCLGYVLSTCFCFINMWQKFSYPQHSIASCKHYSYSLISLCFIFSAKNIDIIFLPKSLPFFL